MSLVRCSKRFLKNISKKENEIIIWGANDFSYSTIKKYDLEKNTDCILDNNYHLYGQCIHIGKEEKSVIIQGINELDKERVINATIVIISMYHELIYRQLVDYCGIGESLRIYFYPSEEDASIMQFRPLFKNRKRKNIIVFRSGLDKYVEGFDFSDNAYAMFEYMLENAWNERYKLVWMVYNREDFLFLEKHKNVKVVSYKWANDKNIIKRLIYQYYLYMSRYFFFTDTCLWLRYCSSDQVRVNLWHGCGFKDRKNKNEDVGTHFEYMTVTSDMYAEIHAKEFGCDIKQMLVTGLAKEDLLFKKNKCGINEALGIQKADKYIFWLPTFRTAVGDLSNLNEYDMMSETGLPVIYNHTEVEKLNRLLQKENIFLVIKLHPVQNADCIKKISYSNIRVVENKELTEKNLQINSLLADVDAVISDYSSVAVDYMLLDRPIAFTVDDLEDYEDSRGFVFDNIKEYLPGKLIYNANDFFDFIIEVSNNIDTSSEKRTELKKKMHKYNDGNSCKRILDILGVE